MAATAAPPLAPGKLTELLAEVEHRLDNDRPGVARALLAVLTRAAPADHRVRLAAARLCCVSSDPHGALQLLRGEPGNDGQAPGWLLWRARAAMAAGLITEALADARRAAALAPGDVACWGMLGILLLESSQPGEAVQAFTDAAALHPDNQAIARGLRLALADVRARVMDATPC